MLSSASRRRFLLEALGTVVAPTAAFPAEPSELFADDVPVPQSVEELWADFDPRRDPLETEVIREWTDGEGTFRHVRFLVGFFRGVPARMTAIYGFPNPLVGRLPAVMHIHGGGQRGFLHEVRFLVSRGYAGLSVNWGGNGDGEAPFNFVEGAEPGDLNTDWGVVDPSQLNAAGYDSILPGPKQLVPGREHPKNCNWYLLTLACRRGLTFLEQQSEVDPERLGVHGYSMGGNLTMYVAGVDLRVKAAVPAVGGAGWRWDWHEFLGGKARLDHVRGDMDVFRSALSFENYAPRVCCPVLHRSATNDFHGWMDDVYRTNALIPNQPTRFSWAPHLNHRLTTEVEVAMPLWFDEHLKGGRPLPKTPLSELVLATGNRTPLLKVQPDSSWEIERCRVFYAVDPDPRARFWRSALVEVDGSSFTAELPLHTTDLPLFAFASVDYRLPQPVSLLPLPGHREPAERVTISGLLHEATVDSLREADVQGTLRRMPVIDDFSRGLEDWYVLNRGNRSHQQIWTRKLTDPLWRGADGQRLQLELRLPETNTLTFVVQENEWRSYRGPRKTFVCEREIRGSSEPQSVSLGCEDFLFSGNAAESLQSWSAADQFGICAHFGERGGSSVPVRMWRGGELELLALRW